MSFVSVRLRLNSVLILFQRKDTACQPCFQAPKSRPVASVGRSLRLITSAVRVRRWPRVVHGSAGYAFGDTPRPVRAVAVAEVPGVWNLAAGEQVDDRSLVAKRVAKLSIAQSHDDFVADPYAANPAALWKKAPGCWQPSGRQRPQEGWVRGRLVDKRC